MAAIVPLKCQQLLNKANSEGFFAGTEVSAKFSARHMKTTSSSKSGAKVFAGKGRIAAIVTH